MHSHGMMDEVLGGLPQKTNDATRLALSRTILAHDRTLMAWVRTSTSMISFGFTIYKFFQFVPNDRTARHAETLLEPRGVSAAVTIVSAGRGQRDGPMETDGLGA